MGYPIINSYQNYCWQTWKCPVSNSIKIAPWMKNLTFLRGRGGGAPGGKGAPIHKCIYQLLLVNIWKCVSNFIKIGQLMKNFPQEAVLEADSILRLECSGDDASRYSLPLETRRKMLGNINKTRLVYLFLKF